MKVQVLIAFQIYNKCKIFSYVMCNIIPHYKEIKTIYDCFCDTSLVYKIFSSTFKFISNPISYWYFKKSL